jgi:hypothetical protein
LECLKTLHDNSPLTVIWRLDEIQNIKNGEGISKHKSKVYQYVSKLMGVTLNSKSGHFIIPIVSETTNATIEKNMPGSSFIIVSVPLFISDFSVDDALRMINEIISIKVTDELKRLIGALGPIPRLIQFLVDYLVKMKGDYNIPEIYDFLCDKTNSLYRIESWHDNPILCHCYVVNLGKMDT